MKSGYVYLIQNRWGSDFFTCVCMCIAFVIQVPKQKNAHELFSCWDGNSLGEKEKSVKVSLSDGRDSGTSLTKPESHTVTEPHNFRS